MVQHWVHYIYKLLHHHTSRNAFVMALFLVHHKVCLSTDSGHSLHFTLKRKLLTHNICKNINQRSSFQENSTNSRHNQLEVPRGTDSVRETKNYIYIAINLYMYSMCERFYISF